MLKLKHRLLFVTFLFSLFSFGCQTQTKYDIIGMWESNCYADKQGKNFKETLHFNPDRTLDKRIHIKYGGKDYSKHEGKYRVKKDSLELTYTKSDLSSETIKNIRDINWLGPNFLEVSGENLECYYTRVLFD